MPEKQQLNWKRGLSPMNIVTLVVICAGAVSAYVRLEAQVGYNTELLESIKYAMEKEHDWAESKHSAIWERIREHKH